MQDQQIVFEVDQHTLCGGPCVILNVESAICCPDCETSCLFLSLQQQESLNAVDPKLRK